MTDLRLGRAILSGRPSAHVRVAHKAEMEAVALACREWEALDPEEVRNWRIEMEFTRQRYETTGGWTVSREMLAGARFPAYVQYRVRRLLVAMGWDNEEARTWERTDDGKNDTPLFKQACRELLPESIAARKEQRQRTHNGWSPAT